MAPFAAATDLRVLFEPRSVALIGASADPLSISARPLRLLRQHAYAGSLYPVNPKYDELLGLRVYPSIGAVPEAVDLALVVVPAPAVAGVLEECAAAGVGCAVVITSGFAESAASGAVGKQLQQDIADVVARSGLRVCGPNSEGIFHPAVGLCATFSPAVDPEHGFIPAAVGTQPGPIAVVSQSGGLAFALLNHAKERGLAVGSVISTGNEVDLGWCDYVDYLLDQSSTRVILGFVESFRQPEHLIAVAHKAARLRKPIVLAKMGRTDAGRRAAASHTASLVGSDAAYSAAFRQLGILRVDDVDELLDLAAYFCVGRLPAGRGVAVLTASGGAGAWLADACAMRGLELPPPDPADQAAIRSFIPAYGSVGNPVDITAQAVLEGGFERALGILAHSAVFDTIVAVVTLVREERFFHTLSELREAIAGSRAAVLYYSYTRASPRVLAALAEEEIPCFSTPGRSARAVSAAVEYAEFLNRLDQVAVFGAKSRQRTPWPAPVGRLSETSSRAYLAPLGIQSPVERLARTEDEAVAAFEALGSQPVALKIQSADLAHKTDVGGVRLGVRTSDEVRAGFVEVGGRLTQRSARLEGVLVQHMAPDGIDVFVAARREPLLGPLVVVGMGGVDVEVMADVTMRLAPISLTEAQAMLGELRSRARFDGARGRPRVDMHALAVAVVRISELAAAMPAGVASIEINPLRVLPANGGVLMLDAAIEMEAP